jgi:hypothetical protein
MKIKLSILVLLLAFTAGAVDVRFNLRDFLSTSQPLVRRTALIEPQSAPMANGTNVIIQERRYFTTGTQGEFTATNMVQGTYRVLVYGPTYTNVFRINVPDTTGSTNASSILISSANNGIETEDGRSIDIE